LIEERLICGVGLWEGAVIQRRPHLELLITRPP